MAIPARLHSGLGAYGEYQAYIDLRSVTIRVTEGCNGLGLILTLGVGALLLAPQMRRGALLLVAVVPLALGANALRVAILSLGVERWGVDFVRGPTLAHELVGWVTWLAALVVRTPGAGVSEDELKPFVRERLARYKVPREIAFVEQLPRTSFLTSTTPRVAGVTGVARGAFIVAPPLDSISVAGPIRWPASVLHAATSM